MNIEDKKITYEKLRFIHQVLTQTSSYRIEEFRIAEDSIKMITDMCNTLSDDIKSQEASSTAKEVVNDQA